MKTTTMIALMLALLFTGCGGDGSPAQPTPTPPAIIAPDTILGATFTYRADSMLELCKGVTKEVSPSSGRFGAGTIRYDLTRASMKRARVERLERA